MFPPFVAEFSLGDEVVFSDLERVCANFPAGKSPSVR